MLLVIISLTSERFYLLNAGLILATLQFLLFISNKALLKEKTTAYLHRFRFSTCNLPVGQHCSIAALKDICEEQTENSEER